MRKKIEQEVNRLVQDIIPKPIHIIPIAENLQNLGDFCFIVNPLTDSDPEAFGKELADILIKSSVFSKTALVANDTKKGLTYYVNIFVDSNAKSEFYSKKLQDIVDSVFNDSFGYIHDFEGKIAVVEHTSANPIAPLHVGNLRNSIQGDTFAKILEHGGYNVYRHFYVNDGGLQICFTVVGYEILQQHNILPPIKFDHWIGQIYAIMNCFYTIQSIKIKAAAAGATLSENRYFLSLEDVESIAAVYSTLGNNISKQISVLSEKNKLSSSEKALLRNLKRDKSTVFNEIKTAKQYTGIFEDLQQRFPKIFTILYEEVLLFNLKERTAEYLQKYESKSDDVVVELFRKMASATLVAFEWTLTRFNIAFDSFDFESDITWSGHSKSIVDRLIATEHVSQVENHGFKFIFPANMVKQLKSSGRPSKLIPLKTKLPDLQLTRSDGTTLYPAKDMAYTIYKYEVRNADVVFNVIASEQMLPQFQMVYPLLVLGYNHVATTVTHYSYELVDLVGRTMSGRLALYVTADEYFDETKFRVRMAKRELDNTSSKKSSLSQAEFDAMLTSVTLASTRFPLIESSPAKRILLDIDRELDLKRNSGPFIEYAYARTAGIIRKANEQGYTITKDIRYSLLASEPLSITILNHIDSLSQILKESIRDMDPSKLSTWVFKLAQYFMKYYETHPILSESKDILQARLLIVKVIKRALFTGLDILGISATDKI